jgi:hypothetical protein
MHQLTVAPLVWIADLWSWVNENGSALGAIAGITATVVAVMALRSSAADNRARSQPMVTAEFRPAPDSDSTIDFVVSNAGPTPARDVKVSFDPELVMPADTSRLVAPFIVKRYGKSIPVLNPGQLLSNTWWAGEHTGGYELENREPTPDQVTVTLSYLGIGRKRIVESFPLTVETVTDTTWSTSSTSLKGRLATIDKSLSAIAKSVAALAKAPRT